MQHPPAHFFDFTPETLADWLAQRGAPRFRASQLMDWVYAKRVLDPAQMSNLSKRDRDLIADPVDGLVFLSGQTVAHQHASDGTQKLLIQWDDLGAGDTGAIENSRALLPILTAAPADTGASAPRDSTRQTECVMIPVDADSSGDGPTSSRRTACISSQVGCPVGCRFCASGIGGLDGNLSAGRIVEQVYRLGGLPEVGRISNVVFMGMGEPLSNFQNVTRAIRTLAAPWGLGIGARKITISTVGLPQAIRKLAAEFDLPVTLALSLHAPNDDIRRTLIPWAEYTTIPDLLSACQEWFAKTGREITLEYIMLRGVNDRPEHARELAAVARSIRANINLIRYNEVKGMAFERPGDSDVHTFQNVLREQRVNVHIRSSRGRDIAAACGQLRHEKSKAQ